MSDLEEEFAREHQLDAIIAEYYGLAEKGLSPDSASFIGRYPDFQQELREFFADLQMFQHSGRSVSEKWALDASISDSLPQRKNPSAGTVVRYFGDYAILEELGSGGMGVVYKARHLRLKKLVALKMIRAGEFASDFEVKLFQAEARAAAKLDHPGIVPVHEVGLYARQHFYAMDYVAGESLSKLHRDEPVPARHAAELVKQIAEAIHYAHGQGIVHRDLKPTNVMLTSSGVPRVTDFGLAKRMWSDQDSVDARITMTGQILGTAGYMSPEQAEGKARQVGPAADVYALGAVLYALLTSRAPFVGESQAHIIMQVIHNEPVSPRALNPSVGRDLETICLKCLNKEQHKRYGSAQLLADDLQRFIQGLPVLARPISRPVRAWRWCIRNRAVAVLSFAILISLLLGTGISVSLAIIAIQRGERLGNSLAAQTELVRLREQALLDVQREVGRSFIEQGVANLSSGEISRGLIRLSQATHSVRSTDPEFAVAQKLISWWGSSYRQPLRHSGAVNCVCISPNGKFIATGSEDKTLKLWDTKTGLLVGRPLVHDDSVILAQFHPQGRIILTATEGGDLMLWDTGTGKLTRRLNPGHPGHLVRKLEFSPDGKMFVAAWNAPTGTPRRTAPGYATTGCATIWDTETGEEVGADFIILEESFSCLAFSPDSRKLATGTGNTARLWKISSEKLGQDPDPLLHPDDVVLNVAFSPDGAILATGGSQGTIRLWNSKTGAALEEPQRLNGSICGIAFIDDGRTLLAGSVGGGISSIEVSTGRLLKSRIGPTKTHGFTVAPNEKQFISRLENQLQLWDLDSGQPLGEPMLHEATIRDVTFSPDGQFAISASDDKSARIWNLVEDRFRHVPISLGVHLPTRIEFCPDLSKIVTTRTTMRIFDTTNGLLLFELKPNDPQTDMFSDAILSSNGKLVLTRENSNNRNTARLWNAETGEVISELTGHNQDICIVAVSPDGKLVATGSYYDKSVRLWSVGDSQQFGAPFILDHLVGEIAFSGDGGQLLVSTRSPANEVMILDIKTREMQKCPIEDEFEISAFAISPDRRFLLTGNEAGVACLWEIEHGKKRGENLTHRGRVTKVAFSPDGESFVTIGEQDTEAILRDTQTLKPRRPPIRPGGPIAAIAFSSDGSRILTASYAIASNETHLLYVREWRIPPTIQRSSEQLKKWIEVLTGLRVDDQNAIRELSDQQLQELQQSFQSE